MQCSSSNGFTKCYTSKNVLQYRGFGCPTNILFQITKLALVMTIHYVSHIRAHTHMCCHERSNVSVNVFYYLIVLSKEYLLFSCDFIEKIIGERTKGHVCSKESCPNNESK